MENAIWEFLEMQPDNPGSWYPDPPRKGIGLEMYHHQAMWGQPSVSPDAPGFRRYLGNGKVVGKF